MRVRLQGRDESVGPEREDSRADPEEPAMFPHALPDQPGAADLGECGEDEQDDRTRDVHNAEPTTDHSSRSVVGSSGWMSLPY
jgi:hypothetical protein